MDRSGPARNVANSTGNTAQVVAAQETLSGQEKARERNVFLFLTVVLAPMVAIGLVSAWGFIVWIFQMFAGPPGPAN